MFYSVPTSDRDIIVQTPFEAKSLKYIYFENKNDNIFLFKKDAPDTVSISVDGKQICLNVPILPFCTSTPYGANKFDWHDVAIEANINVKNSEIKISASTENDYNIIFVCSDEECDETKGFEFIETRTLFLRKGLASDAEILSALEEGYQAKLDEIRTAAYTAAHAVWQSELTALQGEKTALQTAKQILVDEKARYDTWLTGARATLTANEGVLENYKKKIYFNLSSIETQINSNSTASSVKPTLTNKFNALKAAITAANLYITKLQACRTELSALGECADMAEWITATADFNRSLSSDGYSINHETGVLTVRVVNKITTDATHDAQFTYATKQFGTIENINNFLADTYELTQNITIEFYPDGLSHEEDVIDPETSEVTGTQTVTDYTYSGDVSVSAKYVQAANLYGEPVFTAPTKTYATVANFAVMVAGVSTTAASYDADPEANKTDEQRLTIVTFGDNDDEDYLVHQSDIDAQQALIADKQTEIDAKNAEEPEDTYDDFPADYTAPLDFTITIANQQIEIEDATQANLPSIVSSLYAQTTNVAEQTWGQETQYRFEYAPRFMFVYSTMKPVGSDTVVSADMKMNITLSGADAEILPPQTDVDVMFANNQIPFRKAKYDFQYPETIHRELSVVLRPNSHETDSNGRLVHASRYPFRCDWWRVCLMFGYRKLV